MVVSTKVSGWERASVFASWTQTLAVIASLIFIAYQLKQQTAQLDQQVKLSAAANVQASVALITPLNLQLTGHDIAKAWLMGEKRLEKHANIGEKEIAMNQYEYLVASNLVFYENVFWQYGKGLLDKEIFQGWDNDLQGFLQSEHIETYWPAWRCSYHQAFRDRVDQLLKTPQSSCTPSSAPGAVPAIVHSS